MTENMFESMAERLRADVSKEIAYSYVAFIPNDTPKVISNMKSNIALSDRKFLEQDLQKAVGKSLIFPYDILNSNLEKHITDFYDELNLSIKTTERLSAYGSRGEKFKKEFADSLEQSKASTLKSVMHEMNLQMMQSKDAKSAIDHMQKILTKRLLYLKNFLKASAGQLTQYMLLWDYQDKGYTYYRLKVNGDTCEKCTDLESKVFPISEAKSGLNFAPIHPNCDCSAEILDENGSTVFVVGEKAENKENNDSLEYLQASLRQIVLGNYADDVNLVGTLGQVLLGLLGWDLPADIRDITYDVTNFEMSPKHLLQTLLDFVSLLPVVGGIKYTDEVGNVLKPAAKHADEAVEAAKSVDKTINFLEFPKYIHAGRQGKHIVGHNNYENGRSILTIPLTEAEKLLKKYGGTGQKVNVSSERVNFEMIIGKFVDKETGKAYDTTVGTIRYSKDGAHIVPARPLNWRGK